MVAEVPGRLQSFIEMFFEFVDGTVRQGEQSFALGAAAKAGLRKRLLRTLGCAPNYYIPDRLLEGYGPSAEALVRLGREEEH